LQQLDRTGSEFVDEARQNLRQLERYIEAARKQVGLGGRSVKFSVYHELEQVARVMLPLGQRANIVLDIRQGRRSWLYGDPVKFNQWVANLIANAFDAYDPPPSQSKPKRIEVTAASTPPWLRLTVRDWGKGIKPTELPQLFEPFYTTKAANERSLGIG